jgi:hypothetical protein
LATVLNAGTIYWTTSGTGQFSKPVHGQSDLLPQQLRICSTEAWC